MVDLIETKCRHPAATRIGGRNGEAAGNSTRAGGSKWQIPRRKRRWSPLPLQEVPADVEGQPYAHDAEVLDAALRRRGPLHGERLLPAQEQRIRDLDAELTRLRTLRKQAMAVAR